MHSPSHWNSFARLGKSFSGIEQFRKTSCLSSPRIKFPIYEVHLVLFQKQIQRYSSTGQGSMRTCRLSPLLGAHPERPDKTAPRALSTTVAFPSLACPRATTDRPRALGQRVSRLGRPLAPPASHPTPLLPSPRAPAAPGRTSALAPLSCKCLSPTRL